MEVTWSFGWFFDFSLILQYFDFTLLYLFWSGAGGS